MQGHAQVPKPTTEKPTKTIHLLRIHRDLLARGKMPPLVEVIACCCSKSRYFRNQVSDFYFAAKKLHCLLTVLIK